MNRLGFHFSFFFLLLGLNSFGQVDEEFLEHLSTNKLKREHTTYLEKINTTRDSINYYRSKYALQYEDDSTFFSAFRQCEALFFQDELAMDYANKYFLDRPVESANLWFNSLSRLRPEASEIGSIYYAAYQPKEADLGTIPLDLHSVFLRLRKANNKKPLLAASLSALIPGTGKLYIGNTRSFLMTFLSLSILGLQTWESYSRMGWKHPLTILNAGFFSVYYAVNIYGSYRETKEKKREIRQQYLIDASNYYDNFYPGRLY